MNKQYIKICQAIWGCYPYKPDDIIWAMNTVKYKNYKKENYETEI